MSIKSIDLKAGLEFHYDLAPQNQKYVNTALVQLVSIKNNNVTLKIIGDKKGTAESYSDNTVFDTVLSDRCFLIVNNEKVSFSEADSLFFYK